MLCGLAYCPALILSRATRKLSALRGNVLEGSSPPSVYVGWRGYPYVRAGPAAPPVVGDTEVYERPELWLELGVDRVLEMRLSMVHGLAKLKGRTDPLLDRLRELALSSLPVEVEVKFAKPPQSPPVLDPHAPPMGPGGRMESLRVVGNPKVERPVEKAYEDTDMKAEEAILMLYRAGVPVSTIQRVLSVGALGDARRRRPVPTRWSITAVDDTISRALVRLVRDFPSFNEYLVFERRYAKNVFVALVAPGPWAFEWIEAWFPRTAWNRGSNVEVEGDWEDYRGRTTYARIGGCYYAARLATAEYMLRSRRQGVAVLVREIYEGFDVPIGVWFVRENIRRLFSSQPTKYVTLREALEHIDRATRLSLSVWLRESALLRRLVGQRAISEYIRW